MNYLDDPKIGGSTLDYDQSVTFGSGVPQLHSYVAQHEINVSV